MVRTRDVPALSRVIRWKEKTCFYESLDARSRGMKAGDLWMVIDPVPDLFRPGDVLMPALIQAQRWLNEKLDGNASPQLRYDERTTRQVFQIVPKTLLAAMWFQFAQAVEGNRDYRACKECGAWFEVGTKRGAFNKNRLFCSDKCKSKDYRRRKV
jgi:hypothetical protein